MAAVLMISFFTIPSLVVWISQAEMFFVIPKLDLVFS